MKTIKIIDLLKTSKIKQLEDKYELTTKVELRDIKGYLQNEYDRAEEREASIKILESKIDDLEKIKLKYDALLVVQERTTERTERLDEEIKELKEQKTILKEQIKNLNAEKIDIKVNAEKKLKEKDKTIKELKEQIKDLQKKGKKNENNRFIK